MKIEVVESQKHLFVNLVEEDWTIVMETPVFTLDDVKKVLKSYVLFIQSTVVYDSIEHNESEALSIDELKMALETYSDIHASNTWN